MTRKPSANFENEAARLRRLAQSEGVQFAYRRHALIEMEKDGIYRIDVENMLRRCSVSWVEDVKGEETWRAEGRDTEGRRITAVIVAYEALIKVKVITAWAEVKRRKP